MLSACNLSSVLLEEPISQRHAAIYVIKFDVKLCSQTGIFLYFSAIHDEQAYRSVNASLAVCTAGRALHCCGVINNEQWNLVSTLYTVFYIITLMVKVLMDCVVFLF